MFSSHLSPHKLSLFPLWHHSDSLTSGGIKNLFQSSHLSCQRAVTALSDVFTSAGGKLSGVCSRAKVSGWCWRFRSSGWSRGPHDWNYREGDFFFCVKDIRVFLKFTFKVQFEVLIVFCGGKKLSSKVSLCSLSQFQAEELMYIILDVTVRQSTLNVSVLNQYDTRCPNMWKWHAQCRWKIPYNSYFVLQLYFVSGHIKIHKSQPLFWHQWPKVHDIISLGINKGFWLINGA